MRVLAVTWNGGGNLTPLLAMGARLGAAGHELSVIGSAPIAHRFEGVDFTPLGDHEPPARLRGRADDVLAAAARVQPDVLLVDFMQPEALSAVETLDVPVAALVHTLYWRQAIIDRSPMHMAGDVDALNALRSSFDLPSVARVPDVLDAADLVLVATAERLDAPEGPLPSNVRYVGPMVVDAGADAGWEPPIPGDAPLVHASTGTALAAERTMPFLQGLLDGLADAPVRVLVTLPDDHHASWAGAKGDATSLRVPANAAVSLYVRHAALLPHASAFVNHAGLSSIGAALVHGVPLVCAPVTEEEEANAAQVTAAGFGVDVPFAASADDLRAAVLAVLGGSFAFPPVADGAATAVAALEALE